MARTTLRQRSLYRKQLAPLLLLIRTKEANGYDDVVAHLRSRKPANILNLRLSDIRAWQEKWDPITNNGEAVGAYQFTKETIDSIVKGSDIRWEDKFSAVVQDHMAIHLILTRTNAESFLRTGRGENEMMMGIAKIWASFPVPHSVKTRRGTVSKGQSYYSGVGSNAAYVKLTDVRRAVRDSRALAKRTTGRASRVVSMKNDAEDTRAQTRPVGLVRVSKDHVRRYQSWLNTIGAMPKLRIDGLVGPRTKRAASQLGRDHVVDLRNLATGQGVEVKREVVSLASARKALQTLRNPKGTVEVYQTLLNTKRDRKSQLRVDGLYGPATHAAADVLGRNQIADLKSLDIGRRINM